MKTLPVHFNKLLHLSIFLLCIVHLQAQYKSILGNNFENGLNACYTISQNCLQNSLQDQVNQNLTYLPNNNATLSQYWFNGHIVYALDAGAQVSDGGLTIYDAQCAFSCTLYGLGGLTECEGLHFELNAQFLGELWNQQNGDVTIDYCGAEWFSGGSDVFAAPNNGVDNSRSILIRDNSGMASTLWSSPFTVPGNSSINLSFSYLPQSMEISENFIVKLESQTTGQVLYEMNFISGTDFTNDIREQVNLTIQSFPQTDDYVLSFQCDASSNLDKVYLDNVGVSYLYICEVGESCDDGNPCTFDDQIGFDCICEGNFPPNEALSCDCVGVFIDSDEDGICSAEDPDDFNACIPNNDNPNCSNGEECVLYNTVDFEENLLSCTGYDCWEDGGSDVFRWPVNGVDGSASYVLRDNSGVSSSITSPNIYFNNGNQIQIEFSLLANSFENGEGFFIEVFITPEDLGFVGDTELLTRIDYRVGQDFQNDERIMIDALVDYPSNQLYFYNIRIRCDASSNYDRMYIDDVSISACGSGMSCVPGSPCDDNDPCTLEDQFDNLCQCIGFLPPQNELSCACSPVFIDQDEDGICAIEDPDDLDACIPFNDHPLCVNDCTTYSGIDFENYDYNCSGDLCWPRIGTTFISSGVGLNGSAAISITANSNGSASSILSPIIIPIENSIKVKFDYRSNGVTNNNQPFYVDLLQYDDANAALLDANVYTEKVLLLNVDYVDDQWTTADIEFLFPIFLEATYRIRIRNSSTFGNDRYYVDNIVVEGCHVDLQCLAYDLCDDGDPCTIEDNLGTDCNCTGIFVDEDHDGVCDALDQCAGIADNLIGTQCDDGDECTLDDVYNAICECEGLLPPSGSETCACAVVFIDQDQDGVCSSEDPDDTDPCNPDNNFPGCQTSGECSLYFSQSFNSGFGYWIDNGVDVFLWPIRGVDNSPSVVIRDNSGLQSSLFAPKIYEYRDMVLSINFSFIGESMEDGEDFFVEVYFTVDELGSIGEDNLIHSSNYVFDDQEYQNDLRYFVDESIEIKSSGPLAGPAGYGGPGFLTVVFRADASSNYDRVYLDDISIERCEIVEGGNNGTEEMDPECFRFAPCRGEDPQKVYAFDQNCACSLVYDSGPINACHTYNPQDDSFIDFDQGFTGIWSVNTPDVMLRQDPIMGACLSMKGQSESFGDLDIPYTDEAAISFDIISQGAQDLDALAIEFLDNGEVVYKIEVLKFGRDFTNGTISSFATWFPNLSPNVDYDLRLRSNILSDGFICIDNIQTYGCTYIAKISDQDILRELDKVDQITGEESKVQIYPNPASDYLYINGLSKQNEYNNSQISIYDISGQMVKSFSSTTSFVEKIDISDLPNNRMYFVHVSNDNSIVIEKILVRNIE